MGRLAGHIVSPDFITLETGEHLVVECEVFAGVWYMVCPGISMDEEEGVFGMAARSTVSIVVVGEKLRGEGGTDFSESGFGVRGRFLRERRSL